MILDDWELQQCVIQGHLFEKVVASNRDSKKFVKAFMNSDVAKHLDYPYDSLQWMGEAYIFDALLDEVDLETVYIEDGDNLKEVMFWMGYIYRYWHFYTGESSAEIYKQADYDIMLQTYYGYHTLDPRMVVDRYKEAINNKP